MKTIYYCIHLNFWISCVWKIFLAGEHRNLNSPALAFSSCINNSECGTSSHLRRKAYFFPLSSSLLPRAVSGAISQCLSDTGNWFESQDSNLSVLYLVFLQPFLFFVLPQSHQKSKYSGVIHPQRWLKWIRDFTLALPEKKLGFKHLEWLTFIPSWKKWLNENKCASTNSIFLSSSACAFIRLGCVCRRMVRKNIQKNAFWQRKRWQIRSMKFPQKKELEWFDFVSQKSYIWD